MARQHRERPDGRDTAARVCPAHTDDLAGVLDDLPAHRVDLEEALYEPPRRRRYLERGRPRGTRRALACGDEEHVRRRSHVTHTERSYAWRHSDS